MSSAQPKSILKKRPRAAVEPAVEEEPVAEGQQPSDAPLKVPAEELADADEDDEDEELDDASEQDFSAGSDEDEADGESDDDDDAIRELVEEGQERPAKSASNVSLSHEPS